MNQNLRLSPGQHLQGRMADLGPARKMIDQVGDGNNILLGKIIRDVNSHFMFFFSHAIAF